MTSLVELAGWRGLENSHSLLDVPLCCREEIMVMLKISSFLAVYALVVCQMDSFQAAPVR